MSQTVETGHPSTQQLSAFARGELTEAEDQQVETHLADCAACCHTLHGLSDDTLVSLLRQNDPHRHEPTQLPESEQATLPPELANHPKYDLQELLGQGGMGSVYKAQHRMMNRPVALKVINQQLVQNEAAVQRFHREVQAAARLAHPNIVTAYDADQAGDVHFLVMEYVDGIDLAELVRRRGPLPVAEACDYIRQAALGLQHAPRAGHGAPRHQAAEPDGRWSAECGMRSAGEPGRSWFRSLRTPHSPLRTSQDSRLRPGAVSPPRRPPQQAEEQMDAQAGQHPADAFDAEGP